MDFKEKKIYMFYIAKLTLIPGTSTWYRVCDQTWFLSSSGSHKYFYGRDKDEKNYKVDYQRLKDFKLR